MCFPQKLADLTYLSSCLLLPTFYSAGFRGLQLWPALGLRSLSGRGERGVTPGNGAPSPGAVGEGQGKRRTSNFGSVFSLFIVLGAWEGDPVVTAYMPERFALACALLNVDTKSQKATKSTRVIMMSVMPSGAHC